MKYDVISQDRDGIVIHAMDVTMIEASRLGLLQHGVILQPVSHDTN